MSFDFKQLKNAIPKEAEIEVPELAEIWDGGGKPVWKIRALSGDEIGWANLQAAEETQRRIKNLTEAIAEGVGIKDALKEFIGADAGKVAPDGLRRTYFLLFGSVEPKIDFETATRIRKACYPVFLRLTDQIVLLSGQGYDMGKSKPSGVNQKSNAP